MNFSELKSKINLVDFATSNGYAISKDKSWKDCTVCKNSFGEVLLMRYNSVSQSWYYTNPNDPKDKGDIINFVCNKFNLDIKTNAKEINERLSNFSFIPSSSRHFSEPKRKDNEKEFFLEGLRPLKSTRFFSFRGLDVTILELPFLEGQILGYNAKDSNIQNVAFPYYDSNDKIVGAELKNVDFSMCAEGSLKSEGLWHSKVLNEHSYDNLYIGETVLDLLSYVQLSKLNTEDIFLVSANGNYSLNQLRMLDVYVLKAKNVHFLNDNDRQGKFFDLVESGFLGKGHLGLKVLVRDKKNERKISLEFYSEKEGGLDYRQYDYLQNELKLLGCDKKLEQGIVLTEFDYKVGLFDELLGIILKIRKLGEFQFLKPELGYKDFNDQLRKVRGESLNKGLDKLTLDC